MAILIEDEGRALPDGEGIYRRGAHQAIERMRVAIGKCTTVAQCRDLAECIASSVEEAREDLNQRFSIDDICAGAEQRVLGR